MVGVDEVGRGCWAGPLLVVAARAKLELPPGLKDSKLLTVAQREVFYGLLISACEFGEGWVKPVEIDRLGLAAALRLGVRRSLASLDIPAAEPIILDGSVNYLPKKFSQGRCQVKADRLVPIVSAAGIYAKVTRDRFMAVLGQRYPEYNFKKHVGYGTAEHQAAINAFGPVKFVHRFSFRPLRAEAVN